MRVAAWLTLALVAMALPTARADPLSPDERAWLERHGPVRHAPDPGYPPFESFDAQGRLTGINADILNRISRNLDVEFETVRVPTWGDALDSLRNGSVDLLGALAVTPEREEWMDFTRAYTEYGEVFYVTDPALDEVADLRGLRVGVVRDYAAAAWLEENHPGLATHQVDDTRTGLNMLSRGELDAFFENVPVAGYYIQATSLPGIRVMGDPLYYSPASWAVREGEAMLLSIMEKGLDSIGPGELSRIFEYWTGSDISPRSEAAAATPAWVRNLLLAGALSLALAVAWAVALRRTVLRRTRQLRRSERELAILNEGLEARIQERTKALEEANKDLEAFSRTVSHDLRTPLSTFRLQADIVARKVGPLAADVEPHLQKMRSSVDRMDRLIADLLGFAQASRSDLERTRVDLSALAQEVAAALRDAEPGRAVDLHVEPGLVAQGDARLLRVVMENLMANAWKFTRPAARPRVEVASEAAPDGRVFVVRDNGVGFDPAERGRLFQPFQRLHDGRAFEGTGIGLSTVARIVHRHGGRVWADAAPGTGATFRFTLGPSA